MSGFLVAIAGITVAQSPIVNHLLTTPEGQALVLRSLQRKPPSELTIKEAQLLLCLKEQEYDRHYKEIAARQDRLGMRGETEEERLAEARILMSELLRLKAERESLRREWAAFHRREASATKK